MTTTVPPTTTPPRTAPPPDADQRNDGLVLSVGEKSSLIKYLEADRQKVMVDTDGVLVKEINDWRQLGHIIEILSEGKEVRLRFKDGEPAELRDGKTMRQFLVEIQSCKVSEMLVRSRDILSGKDGNADLTESLDFYSYDLSSKRDKPITVREVMDLRRVSPSSVDWDKVEQSIREKIKQVANLSADVPKHDVVVWTSECTQDKVAEITAKIWAEVKDGSTPSKSVMLEHAHVWPHAHLSPMKDPLGEIVTERSMSIFHDYAEKEREAHAREKAKTVKKIEDWTETLKELAKQHHTQVSERKELLETISDKIDEAKAIAAAKSAEAEAARQKLTDPNDPDLVRLVPDAGLRKLYLQIKQAIEEAQKDLAEKDKELAAATRQGEELRAKKESLEEKQRTLPRNGKTVREHKDIERELTRNIPREEQRIAKQIGELDTAVNDLRTKLAEEQVEFENSVAAHMADALSPSNDPNVKHIPELEAEAKHLRAEAEQADAAAKQIEESIKKAIKQRNDAIGQIEKLGQELQSKIQIGAQAADLLDTSRSEYDAAKEKALHDLRNMLKQIELKEAEAAQAAASGPVNP